MNVTFFENSKINTYKNLDETAKLYDVLNGLECIPNLINYFNEENKKKIDNDKNEIVIITVLEDDSGFILELRRKNNETEDNPFSMVANFNSDHIEKRMLEYMKNYKSNDTPSSHFWTPRFSIHYIWKQREAKGEHYNIGQLAFIIKCVIENIDFLRKIRIIHRNIKLQNIVYDSEQKTYMLTNFTWAIEVLPNGSTENEGKWMNSRDFMLEDIADFANEVYTLFEKSPKYIENAKNKENQLIEKLLEKMKKKEDNNFEKIIHVIYADVNKILEELNLTQNNFKPDFDGEFHETLMGTIKTNEENLKKINNKFKNINERTSFDLSELQSLNNTGLLSYIFYSTLTSSKKNFKILKDNEENMFDFYYNHSLREQLKNIIPNIINFYEEYSQGERIIRIIQEKEELFNKKVNTTDKSITDELKNKLKNIEDKNNYLFKITCFIIIMLLLITLLCFQKLWFYKINDLNVKNCLKGTCDGNCIADLCICYPGKSGNNCDIHNQSKYPCPSGMHTSFTYWCLNSSEKNVIIERGYDGDWLPELKFSSSYSLCGISVWGYKEDLKTNVFGDNVGIGMLRYKACNNGNWSDQKEFQDFKIFDDISDPNHGTWIEEILCPYGEHIQGIQTSVEKIYQMTDSIGLCGINVTCSGQQSFHKKYIIPGENRCYWEKMHKIQENERICGMRSRFSNPKIKIFILNCALRLTKMIFKLFFKESPIYGNFLDQDNTLLNGLEMKICQI